MAMTEGFCKMAPYGGELPPGLSVQQHIQELQHRWSTMPSPVEQTPGNLHACHEGLLCMLVISIC